MATKAKKSKVAPFVWFEPETTALLMERLIVAGPGARLEMRQIGKGWTLRVVAGPGVAVAGVSPDDLNKSHTCPPQCP